MTSPDDLEGFSYLWDGSEPGWEVHWHHHVVWVVTVYLDGSRLTPDEVSRVRKLVPVFGEMPAADAYRALVGRESFVYPGELGHIEKRQVVEQATALGFRVSLESLDRSGGLPYHPGRALLIDDDELARRVCDKMKEMGCRLVHVEVD